MKNTRLMWMKECNGFRLPSILRSNLIRMNRWHNRWQTQLLFIINLMLLNIKFNACFCNQNLNYDTVLWKWGSLNAYLRLWMTKITPGFSKPTQIYARRTRSWDDDYAYDDLSWSSVTLTKTILHVRSRYYSVAYFRRNNAQIKF